MQGSFVSLLAALLISVETMHAVFSRFKGFKLYFIICTFHHVQLSINVIRLALYITLVCAVKAWCCWKINSVNGYHYYSDRPPASTSSLR